MVPLGYGKFTGFLSPALHHVGVKFPSHHVLLIAACLSGLVVSGCNEAIRVTAEDNKPDAPATAEAPSSGGVIKVISSLQCPQTLGTLTRKGPLAENGRRCSYTGPRGSEVTLHLVDTAGQDFSTLLQRYEAELETQMPEAVQAIADRRRENASANASQAEAGDAQPKVTSASTDSNAQRSQVRLPGIRIDANGDEASVRIGGLHIDANEGGADINITGDGESVSIQAAENAAEVRTRQSTESLQATWTLTSEDPSPTSRLRRVGYQARGPASGPIVVATFQSRSDEGDALDDDIHELVVLNVGGAD